MRYRFSSPIGFHRLSASAVLLALSAPSTAAARPTSPPTVGDLVRASDTVVVGRIGSEDDLQPLPRIITDYTMFTELAVIDVYTVLKGASSSQTGKLTVRVHSYHRVPKGAFAIFFLHTSSPGGNFVNAAPDHWTLPARQFSEERGQQVSDPIQGVTREMVGILGTSEKELNNPTTGVNYLDDWMLPARINSIFSVGSQALQDVPVPMVEASLHEAAHLPDERNRLWATDCLITLGFF